MEGIITYYFPWNFTSASQASQHSLNPTVWFEEKPWREEEQDGIEISIISIALSVPLFLSLGGREALSVWATGLKNQKAQRLSQFKLFWYVRDSVRLCYVYEEHNLVGCYCVWGWVKDGKIHRVSTETNWDFKDHTSNAYGWRQCPHFKLQPKMFGYTKLCKFMLHSQFTRLTEVFFTLT